MEKQYEIGNLITKLRKEKKLTQSKLAESLGVTDKSVSKWENGKCLPDARIMPRLCEILGITVEELLNGELNPITGSAELDDLQRLEHVYKYYSDDSRLNVGVYDVNLTMNLGEVIAITGPSGSGKSTLLKTIAGMVRFEHGEIYIRKEGISRFDERDYESYRKSFVGYISQSYGVLEHYSLLDNLIIVRLLMGDGYGEAKKKARDMLRKLGFFRFANKKASKLSGGQKQKLAIARALLKDTPMILGDEITASLDKKSAKEALSFLFRHCEGKVVVLVTHHFEEMEEWCTRKIVMGEGRIVSDESLMVKPKLSAKGVEEPVRAKKRFLFIPLLRNRFGLFCVLSMLALIPVGTTIAGNYGLDIAYEQTSHRSADRLFSENELLVRKQDGFSMEEAKRIATSTEGTGVIAIKHGGEYRLVATPKVEQGKQIYRSPYGWGGTSVWFTKTEIRLEEGYCEMNLSDYLEILPTLCFFLKEQSSSIGLTYLDGDGVSQEWRVYSNVLILDESVTDFIVPQELLPEGSRPESVILPDGTAITDVATQWPGLDLRGRALGIPKRYFECFAGRVTDLRLLCPKGEKAEMKASLVREGYVCATSEDELGSLQDNSQLFIMETAFAGISIIVVTVVLLLAKKLSSSILKSQKNELETLHQIGFSFEIIGLSYAGLEFLPVFVACLGFAIASGFMGFTSPVLLWLSFIELACCCAFLVKGSTKTIKKLLELER